MGEHEFEVGDRVKVKADAGGHKEFCYARQRRGQTGAVTRVWRGDVDPMIRWDTDGGESLCFADALEPLVEQPVAEPVEEKEDRAMAKSEKSIFVAESGGKWRVALSGEFAWPLCYSLTGAAQKMFAHFGEPWPAPNAELAAKAERLEKECGRLRTLHGAADVLVNDLEASAAPNLRAHTVEWGGETFEIIVRRPAGKTLDQVLRDLRGRHRGLEREIFALQENLQDCRKLRAADAAVVEAAVARVRQAWGGVTDEDLAKLTDQTAALIHAVYAHPSYPPAEPEPAPEPDICEGCGGEMPAPRVSVAPLCGECHGRRNKLNTIFEEAFE